MQRKIGVADPNPEFLPIFEGNCFRAKLDLNQLQEQYSDHHNDTALIYSAGWNAGYDAGWNAGYDAGYLAADSYIQNDEETMNS